MQRDAQLKQRILEHLRGFALRSLAEAAPRAAAVAVAITDEGHGAGLAGLPESVEWSTRAALVLTRRADGLRSHAGQWALPGGRVDAGESPEQAALRELAEEVGLQLGPADVLGRLDDFVSRSGYVMTPVLVWAGAAREMTPNPHEVQSIHRIPVDELLRPDAPMLEPLEESAHPVLRMPVGDSWIAAPTAAILYQFRELCIRGRPTRVAHFEQPHFAWR
jgi:8-oxo-dGTP pyrophosphatase MutT (NUDIX family)